MRQFAVGIAVMLPVSDVTGLVEGYMARGGNVIPGSGNRVVM